MPNTPTAIPPVSAACYKITGCAINILNTIGPGLNASIYENCLMIELAKQNIGFEAKKEIEIVYDGQKVGSTIVPLIVGKLIVVRCISSNKFNETDYSENIAYLKNLNLPLALLLNFQFGKLQWKKIVVDPERI